MTLTDPLDAKGPLDTAAPAPPAAPTGSLVPVFVQLKLSLMRMA